MLQDAGAQEQTEPQVRRERPDEEVPGQTELQEQPVQPGGEAPERSERRVEQVKGAEEVYS